MELGDVIVSASDGLFDNLFYHEIHAIIKKFKEEQYKEALNQVSDRGEADLPLPCMLHTVEQATEVANRLVLAARAKVDAGA